MVFYGTRDCASSVRQYQSNCSFSWATCFEGTALKRGWDHWRQVVHDVVDNPFFEWTILLLIFASRHVLSGSDRHTERPYRVTEVAVLQLRGEGDEDMHGLGSGVSDCEEFSSLSPFSLLAYRCVSRTSTCKTTRS